MQVQQWFQTRRSQEKDSKREGADANLKEITAFLNTNTPVKRTEGVVASKVAAREVEVVDILDDSVEEEAELSLVESPLLRCVDRSDDQFYLLTSLPGPDRPGSRGRR